MRQHKNAMYLVWVLSKTDFSLRYHGSILGFLWALLKPLFMFVILNFVFSHLFGGTREYSLGLLTGLMLWTFFAEGTTTGLGSLLSKGHILKKINAPAWTMVLASLCTSLYSFLLSLVVLGCFFLWYGVLPSPAVIPGLVLYGLSLILLVSSMSFVAAPLYVRLRDLNQIWEVLLAAGFYATPIIYPLQVLPEHIRGIVAMSPLAQVIEGWKQLLLSPTPLTIASLSAPLTLLCLLVLGLSLVFFQFSTRGIAEYV